MKLSVITINRNNAEGLRRTMESVFTQTYSDFEYIVVDGASIDASMDVIAEFASQSHFFSFRWVSEPDNGLYCAMNKGIRMATGEYLQFLNSGDWLTDSNMLQEIFSSSIEADVIYGNRIDVYNTEEKKLWYAPHKITTYFLWNSMISHQASFIRKCLFDTIGLYREDLKYASDWEFFLKAFVRHNATSSFIDCFIVYYDTGGISSDPNNSEEMFSEREQVFKETLPYLVDDFKCLDACLKKNKNSHISKLFDLLLVFPRRMYRELMRLRENKCV